LTTESSAAVLTGHAGALPAMLAAALAGARALEAAARAAAVVKADGTPQTAADLASDAAIRAALERDFPHMPIVSEEHLAQLPDRFADDPFLLVDPLDGTREYIEGHPDYAVCIALIEHRRPVAGVIVAPRLRKAWTAAVEARELMLTGALEPSGEGRLIRAACERVSVQNIVTSRSRPDPVLSVLQPGMPKANVRRIGAVLKLVAVATGEACLFPASNPSSEWDIAAGEALVLAAGGVMLGCNGEKLTYGHAERRFLNKPYAAGANEAIVRAALAQWPAN
jgi:3'(2'), 5'-bisphosphate nucleotidase